MGVIPHSAGVYGPTQDFHDGVVLDPETRHAASLVVAAWALKQPDPEGTLDSMLRVLGLKEGHAGKECLICKRSRPWWMYADAGGKPRLKTCWACRSEGRHS